MASAGVVFTEQTLADIAALDLSVLASAPAACVLLVDGARHDKLCALVRESGAKVEQRVLAGGESALESPAEYATVPEEIVETICDWVGHVRPGAGGRADEPASAPTECAAS